MVAGETEALLELQMNAGGYDDFLFGKRRKLRKVKIANPRRETRIQNRLVRKTRRANRRIARQNSPTRALRKERRRSFVNNLVTTYKNATSGNSQGKPTSVLPPPFNPNMTDDSQGQKSDYQISFGTKKEETTPRKKGVPTAVYVVGGVAILGIIGAIVMKKSTPVYPTN